MFRFSQHKHPNFLKAYHSAENLINDIPVVKRRRLLRRHFLFLKWFSISVVAVFLLLIIAFGAQIAIAKSVLSEASAGRTSLEQAVELVRAEKFADAMDQAKDAQENFSASIADLDKIGDNFLVKRSGLLSRQVRDLRLLLDSARILSGTVEKASLFADDLEGLLGENKKLSFARFTKEEKERLLKRIYISGPELASINDDIIAAIADLDNLGLRGILFPFRDQIDELKSKLAYAQETMSYAIPVSRIIPRLVGYPSKSTYLLVLENDDELRPTGGFLGTYGIMELEAGDITRLDTHDIYHMDMPVKDKVDIVPPDPIKQYLNKKWYMRDANWSPDWPTSAEKILWFYQLENKFLTGKNQINNFDGQFTGVIAVTPQLIRDLLIVTGPINVGGQLYDYKNFSNVLQYKVEKGYVQLGIPSWQRKEVIGDIVKELKIRLFDMPSERWGEIIGVLKKNTLTKDIQVYSRDRELESWMKDYGWGGEIKNTDGDYLLAVDANLAALKTDAVMKRNISYKVKKTDKGLFAQLTLNYSHNGKLDWKTSKYQSYTRIYVPLGSQLVAVTGGKGDTATGVEADKTFFGTFMTVDPGKIANLTFEYKLPDRLSRNGSYSLLVQKQPGKTVDDMVVDLSLGSGVKSYSPTGFYANKREEGGIRWETDLNTDKLFAIDF